jgi:hypothetical protein
MTDRTIVLDTPTPADASTDASAQALLRATERAEVAEAKLAKVSRQSASTHTDLARQAPVVDSVGAEELRRDSVMAHLTDSLNAGKNIGHYGRLVFAMVARHFLSRETILSLLTQDKDFSAEQAELMLTQVEIHDYIPPKRERLLEWQSQQDFPILPNPEDPDCGNLYRSLKFPEVIYEHISQYQTDKSQSRGGE